MYKGIRNAFISGLLLLAPLAVTIFVINLLVENLGNPVRENVIALVLPDNMISHPLIDWTLSFISLLIVFILITLLGWFSNLLIGRFVVGRLEDFVKGVPIVRNLYLSVKQIVDTFSQQQKAVFQETVIIEFPRPGVYALGFLTSKGKGEIQHRTKAELHNVFMPTTPNPTSGFLLMVPREQIIRLNMTITDGMKLIISGGAVVPAFDPETGKSTSVPFENPEMIPEGAIPVHGEPPKT